LELGIWRFTGGWSFGAWSFLIQAAHPIGRYNNDRLKVHFFHFYLQIGWVAGSAGGVIVLNIENTLTGLIKPAAWPKL
jgi:hypothetical protein